MSWIRAVWNGLGVLFAVVLLKNICGLWVVVVFAQSLDSRYIMWANIVGVSVGVLILVAILVDSLNIPYKYTLIRVTGFVIALFIPSYDWLEEAWRANASAARYNEMISRVRSDPKVVLLERKRSDVGTKGVIFTFLIYDESDQIELRFDRRSAVWQQVAPIELFGVINGTCPSTVTKIKGHFFYVIEDCTK